MNRRIFVAGASGVMGRHLLPLLVADGHVVAGLTRTAARAADIAALGATPVVCDVYDPAALAAAVSAFAPDTIVHQLTDLPDDQAAVDRDKNARIREEGTANLVAAMRAAGASVLVAASIAWRYGPSLLPSAASLERQTLAVAGPHVTGVVLRYGQWYGPGTYHPDVPPAPPRVHIAAAAAATREALDLPSGIYVVDDDGTHPRPTGTLFEAAGGEVGLRRLAHAWHERVLADEVVAHAFAGGYHPDHTARLAAYWAEALGGPAAYTTRFGDESAVVRMHSGNGVHEEMDRRAIECFALALDDAGLGRATPLGAALYEYFAWATTTTMTAYHQSAADVPADLGVPHWGWDGLEDGASPVHVT